MEETEGQEKLFIKVGVIAAVVVVFLLIVIFAWHSWTTKRQKETVLHSGVTYTGPTPTGGQQAPSGNVFTASPDEPTQIIQGEQYDYSFAAPQSLVLVRLDENPYDIWAVKFGNILPSSAVLIGVDNFQNNDKLKEFINQPKIAYVENWWKQFSGLTGVESITPFTNSKGLKGYKAKYLTGGGPSGNDDVFFEVPESKNLMIHLSNGVLAQDVFDRIIDSVSWGETEIEPTTSSTSEE